MESDNDPPSRRDFDRLSTAVERLERTISLTYVRVDNYERDQRAHDATHKTQQDDIDSLVGWRDWALRIIVGAVMLALLGLVVVQR